MNNNALKNKDEVNTVEMFEQLEIYNDEQEDIGNEKYYENITKMLVKSLYLPSLVYVSISTFFTF